MTDIASMVIALDPAADPTQLATLIVKLVPHRARRTALAAQLIARPDLLTGAGAYGSAAVVKLIDALRAHGVTAVTAPSCPFCDRSVRLTRGRDGLRCCMLCWNQVHAKPCARCGQLGVNERRTSDGRSLCGSCCHTEPSLREKCSGCGRMELIVRRSDDVVFCRTCWRPPTAVCSVCGRRKPCQYADTNAPCCKNCSDKRRAQPCLACGRERTVNRRTDTGQPLCRDCADKDICTGCQRFLSIRGRTEKGGLCQTCYKKDVASHRRCYRCGAVELLHRHRLCPACAWPEALRTLLTSADGNMRPELEPVLAALCEVDARTGLRWIARTRTQKMLAALADAIGPVTHAMLDALSPAGTADHLRTILVDRDVLPIRDELLNSLERSVDRRIERVDDPNDRKILRGYATWHHLRRLRAIAERRPITHEQVIYACNSLTAAANLLNWLRESDKQLATCTQSDIDEWLTHDPFCRARGFVTWAVGGGHAHDIEIPRFNNELTREVFGDHDRRWSLARWLLDDDTVPLSDRVAGLLVLLYAQRVTNITQLTAKHVSRTDAGIGLLLGNEPITVLPALGELISTMLADQKSGAAPDHQDPAWLFPGPRRGQRLPPRVLVKRLAAIGIPATIGRNSALMELAAEMPAAVISGLLGISVMRASLWTHDAGNTRSGYAAEVARRI